MSLKKEEILKVYKTFREHGINELQKLEKDKQTLEKTTEFKKDDENFSQQSRDKSQKLNEDKQRLEEKIKIFQIKNDFLVKTEDYGPTPENNSKDNIRLCTFNVHYWTNVWENHQTMAHIMYDLQQINADITVLQEVLYGASPVKVNDTVTVDCSKLHELMRTMKVAPHFSFCNSVPSWFDALYGNMLLISNKVCSVSKTENAKLCERLDETVHTFSKSTRAVEVGGMHTGTKETRCYIKVKLSTSVAFYGTHLDVASEKTRKEQLVQIVKDARETKVYAIIAGDFNTTDNTIQTEEWQKKQTIESFYKFVSDGSAVEYLKSEGYRNMNSTPTKDQMTCWSKTTVDFFFTNIPEEAWTRENLEHPVVHFFRTSSSDHIPLYVDIPKKIIENITWKELEGNETMYRALAHVEELQGLTRSLSSNSS